MVGKGEISLVWGGGFCLTEPHGASGGGRCEGRESQRAVTTAKQKGKWGVRTQKTRHLREEGETDGSKRLKVDHAGARTGPDKGEKHKEENAPSARGPGKRSRRKGGGKVLVGHRPLQRKTERRERSYKITTWEEGVTTSTIRREAVDETDHPRGKKRG